MAADSWTSRFGLWSEIMTGWVGSERFGQGFWRRRRIGGGSRVFSVFGKMEWGFC